MTFGPRRPSLGILSNLIAHAGGRVDGHLYTNSLEAVKSSIERGFSAIELDVLACRDGFLIVHDGMEKSYGVTAFADENESEFNQRFKCLGRFTPLTFPLLRSIGLATPGLKWVIDSKVDDIRRYGDLLKRLRNEGLADLIIPQVYSYEDAVVAVTIGYEELLFATWKNFASDVLSDACYSTVLKISSLSPSWLGLSMRHDLWGMQGAVVTDDRRFRRFAELRRKIYFHAFQGENEPFLKRAWGVFSG